MCVYIYKYKYTYMYNTQYIRIPSKFFNCPKSICNSISVIIIFGY